LGLSPATLELMQKNRVKIAADLVKRSEKDMYKIQGLNKKILLEVKSALRGHGMEIRADEQAQKPDQNGGKKVDAAKPQQDGTQKSKSAKGDKPAKPEKFEEPKKERKARFGLADREGEGERSQKQSSQQSEGKRNTAKTKTERSEKSKPERSERPEKLTAPLPVEEWRKVLKGGKWGYSNGFTIVIPTMYDEIFAFKEGLASVEIAEKCGYIDSENNLVIPLMYDTAMSFSEGLAMVCVGEKCGYINKENVMVIEPQFDAATAFEGGEAKVKKDGKWATLLPNGTLTWI
ncbi:MAG: WG repeat-containing protein, partial [Clostridia bacterium]|nr:WG repeat-containing protein [Clostridia bacterium]